MALCVNFVVEQAQNKLIRSHEASSDNCSTPSLRLAAGNRYVHGAGGTLHARLDAARVLTVYLSPPQPTVPTATTVSTVKTAIVWRMRPCVTELKTVPTGATKTTAMSVRPHTE